MYDTSSTPGYLAYTPTSHGLYNYIHAYYDLTTTLNNPMVT